MALIQLPFAANMSEFVYAPISHLNRHATCGELAILGGLHAVHPDVWPLTGLQLDLITRDMIAHGQAGDPQGASTAGDLVAYLGRRGYHCTYIPVSDLHTQLDAWGGIMPVVIEYSEAGRLPGDEAGVQFHYNTVVGWDKDAAHGTFVDGDNIVVRRSSDGYGPLVWYSWDQVMAARPYTAFRIEVGFRLDISQPEVARYYDQVSATEWKCKANGFLVHGAILDFYRTISAPYAGLTVLGLPKTNEIALGGAMPGEDVFQVFERGVLVYDPSRAYDFPPGAAVEVYFGHLDREPVVSQLKTLGI